MNFRARRNAGYLLASLTLAVFLSGCTLITDLTGASALPKNEGRRLDIVVGDIQGTRQTDELRSMIQNAWAQDAELRDWFVMVDRVVDPSSTVFINVLLHPYEQDSRRIGNAKHGFSTLRSVTASVSVELVDARSGVVAAAGSGRGGDTNSNGSPNNNRALQRAIQSGLRQAVLTYAGG